MDGCKPRDFPEDSVVAVLTTRPLDGCLDYTVPPGGVDVGAFVQVPIGSSEAMGIVWGKGEGAVAPGKLRRIRRLLAVQPMRSEMRDFLRRVAEYTVSPLPAVLRLATRTPGILVPAPTRDVFSLTGFLPQKLTDARSRVVRVLEERAGIPTTAGELAEAAGVTVSVIKGLEKLGSLRKERAPVDESYPKLQPSGKDFELTEDQAQAATFLKSRLNEGTYSTTLLKGVTGSGKTEVYLEAVTEALRLGQQALVLLPEIALTAQFLDRVAERLGGQPGIWHSAITPRERRRLWRMASEGKVQLVVGARSALFLPFRKLGLIVVDEEHDSSFKQEEGVHYNARDMAVLRASICGANAVLCSATPSLETWVNARSGKYARLDLPARYGLAAMPDLESIDMREAELPRNRWISGGLALEVQGRLSRGEQSLLFLNRRGYAPLTVCRACGNQIGCADCDARMVEHRFRSCLVCHQCGAERPVPSGCPECGVQGKLVPVGPGVERLEEEARILFENARITVLSSDTIRSQQSLKDIIDLVARGDTDIIIGTQLVAKGHNFPLLTLVGVIDTDIGLQGGDYRAAERTFQLVRQVAGRAGRAEKKGLALMQTCQPEHPVIQAIVSDEDEGFWVAEAAEREVAGAPPFGRYAGIVVSGRNSLQVVDFAKQAVRNANPLFQIGAQVFGPAPAPIARIRGRTRYRILVKANRNAPLQAAIRAWTKALKIPTSVHLSVDIDPQRFL